MALVDDAVGVTLVVGTVAVIALAAYTSQPANQRNFNNAVNSAIGTVKGWFHKSDNGQKSNDSNKSSEKADQLKANAEKGKASEEKVLNDKGVPKNTEKVSTSEGSSIPDHMNEKVVGEVKDAKTVSNTKQLRIQKEAAAQSGREHELTTGENTHVTDNAAKGTNVVRRPDLGPKE